MRKITIFALCALLSFLKLSFAQSSSFVFVKAKSEKVGNNLHQMELYAAGDAFIIEEIKKFCLQRKAKFAQDSSTMFSYVVFFDSKVNAKFPNNPLTAGYNDGGVAKHIKAIYEFNRVNGYSKLRFYKKNSWESLVQEFSI